MKVESHTVNRGISPGGRALLWYIGGPMNRFRHHRLKPLLLLSAALLLRAAIPAGYMPAAAGSGLLFEFCPEGISVEFMQILAGDGDTGHAHNHGDSSHGDDHKCPVGHMLLSAAAVDNAAEIVLAPAVQALSTTSSYSFNSVSRTYYHSRGPPA